MIAAERRDTERAFEAHEEVKPEEPRPDTATTDAGDSRPQTAEEEFAPDDLEQAAVRIQAAFRGNQTRQTLEAGLGSGGGISPEGSPVSGEAGAEKAPEPERQRTKEDLLRELEALEKEAEANHSAALGIGEQGALVDLGPLVDRPSATQQQTPSVTATADARSGAKDLAPGSMSLPLSVLMGGESSGRAAQEIKELETSIATLKERLKERNAQKRDLLNELMEARKLVWEYKQEATKAKQGIKALLQDCGKSCADVGVTTDIPDMDAPPEGDSQEKAEKAPARPQHAMTLSPRGAGGAAGGAAGGPGGSSFSLPKSKSMTDLASTTVQHYVQMQDSELRKSISKLAEARMVAHAYMRMIEERTDVIRQLEGELEKSRLKNAIAQHPCGEVMLSERMRILTSSGGSGGGPGEQPPFRPGKSGPLSMPSLREDPEEEASGDQEHDPTTGPKPAMLLPPREEEGSSTSSSSSSATQVGPTSPTPARGSSSGATKSKYTFQQLSILTSTVESVVVAYGFRALVNNMAEQEAAIRLQAVGRGAASRKLTEGRRRWRDKEPAVATIVGGLDKLDQFAEFNSFTLAVEENPAKCLRSVMRHLKGYVGIHFATELLQSQMKVHLARKSLARAPGKMDVEQRSRPGGRFHFPTTFYSPPRTTPAKMAMFTTIQPDFFDNNAHWRRNRERSRSTELPDLMSEMLEDETLAPQLPLLVLSRSSPSSMSMSCMSPTTSPMHMQVQRQGSFTTNRGSETSPTSDGAGARPKTVPALPLKNHSQKMAVVPAATENGPPVGQSYALADKNHEMRTVSQEQRNAPRPQNQAFEAKNTIHFFKTAGVKNKRQNPDRIRRPGSTPNPGPRGESAASRDARMVHAYGPGGPAAGLPPSGMHSGNPSANTRANPLLNRQPQSGKLQPRATNAPLPQFNSTGSSTASTRELSSTHPRRGVPMQTISTSESGGFGPMEWEQWGANASVTTTVEQGEGDSAGVAGQQLFYPASKNSTSGQFSEADGGAADPLQQSVTSGFGAEQELSLVQTAGSRGGSRGRSRPMNKKLPPTGPGTRHQISGRVGQAAGYRPSAGALVASAGTGGGASRQLSRESSTMSGGSGEHKHLHHHYHVFLPADQRLPRGVANENPSLATRLPNMAAKPIPRTVFAPIQ